MLSQLRFEPFDELWGREGVQLDPAVGSQEFLFLLGSNGVRWEAPLESDLLALEPVFLYIRKTQSEIDNVDLILEFIFHKIVVSGVIRNGGKPLGNLEPSLVEIVGDEKWDPTVDAADTIGIHPSRDHGLPLATDDGNIKSLGDFRLSKLRIETLFLDIQDCLVSLTFRE